MKENNGDGYLTIHNLTKTFGSVTAVDNVSLDISEGETLCLLGPSGCGKTTILRVIAGLLDPDAGSVLLDGEQLLDTPIHQRDIGLVFQTWALFPHMTVAANVAFGLKMRDVPADERIERVDRILSMVGLREMQARRPAELSGGQQQRVALARALVTEPRLLLLDEPLSSLDLKIRIQLRREIRRIQESLGLTTIYVTHDHSEALALGDQVAVMSTGTVVEVGPPTQIFARPRTRYVADFLGSNNIIVGTLRLGPRPEVAELEVVDGTKVEIPAPDLRRPIEEHDSVGVSPWDVDLGRSEDPGPSWPAEVLGMEYHAGRALLTLAVDGLGTDLTCYADQTSNLVPGDRTSVSIRWSEATPLEG